MGFRIVSRYLGDVAVIAPEVFYDQRGYFFEIFHAAKYRALALPDVFVQDNQSLSSHGVVRGLHFQWDPPMSKLMRVTLGSAFLVAVDIRKNSPTLGQWCGVEATEENNLMVWAPPGFARGICVTSERAKIQYKCTALYNPGGESSIRFDDPDLKIAWPRMEKYVLSDKDRNAMSFQQFLASPLADKFSL
jgi:dTDP-4-dehydrorhamnose 3,5-epimerase